MRVGFIAPAFIPTDGWGRYTRDLAAVLDTLNVEVIIVTTSEAPATTDIPNMGYYPALLPTRERKRWFTPRSLAYLPTVRRLVRECDLVHCTGEIFIPLTAFVGKPFVITAHGTYLPRALRRRVMGRVFAWAARRAAALICVSNYTKEQVQIALPGIQLHTIPNGVHWERLAQPSGAPPEQKRGPVILGVGQMKGRKGFHIVAEAMQTVRERYPSAEYVIVGNPEYEPELAARLNAMPGVRVLGRLDDATLRAWYHHADLLAQTPVQAGDKFEGFGLVFLEAGAAGIPSVGARGSGAQEAIIHEKTGLLVAQNDVEATAAAILRLLNDDALRRQLGENARRHAQANGWDQVAEQILDIYQAVMSNKR